MRLFEAIIDANHRAVAGDASAGLHPADFADELPVIALTCIDPRLNAFFPNALALPAEKFIWLRNAGNNVTGPMSSTLRSLALACAVKGGREIAVIGHTDCQIAKTTTMALLEKFAALGVDRTRLPENLGEFFGTFASERQNVVKACDFIRSSPLIGPKIPVHGLMLDLNTGRVDWVVNGYEAPTTQPAVAMANPFPALETLGGAFKDFALGEMKFPEPKIGELVHNISETVSAARTEIPPAQSPLPPVMETAKTVAAQIADLAEKRWPKPPPLKMKSPPPFHRRR